MALAHSRWFIFNNVEIELDSARLKYAEFHSLHEGYAVLKEEVDELLDLIKASKEIRADYKMKKECIQIMAMALRFIEDLYELP